MDHLKTVAPTNLPGKQTSGIYDALDANQVAIVRMHTAPSPTFLVRWPDAKSRRNRVKRQIDQRALLARSSHASRQRAGIEYQHNDQQEQPEQAEEQAHHGAAFPGFSPSSFTRSRKAIRHCAPASLTWLFQSAPAWSSV